MKLAVPIAVGALSLGLAACGSSSPSSATASSSSASTTSGRYQARLNLAKCLRAHGLNVSDPSANGGAAGGDGLGLRTLRDSPNFNSAMQACAKYRAAASPLANLTPAQRAQFQRDLVKFARCMRSHGIDVPDPTTSPGGGFGIFRRSLSPSLRNSPGFQSALQACSTNLPFRPGGGPGGAAGGPPPGGPGA